MATKKATLPKKQTLNQRIAAIRAFLKKEGWSLALDSSTGFNLERTKGSYDEVIVSIERDQVPFCCGVEEIGTLSIDGIRSVKASPETKRAFEAATEAFLLELKLQAAGASKAAVPVGEGLIICSNGKDGWELIEPILENKLCEDWILASKTRNGTKGSVIKLFVAKF